jgi:hypothetical protein
MNGQSMQKSLGLANLKKLEVKEKPLKDKIVLNLW